MDETTSLFELRPHAPPPGKTDSREVFGAVSALNITVNALGVDAYDRTVGHAVVGMISKLERMACREIEPERRIALLKVIMPRVMEMGSGMPKSVASARHSVEGSGIGQTLEQRLYGLFAKNFRIALETFDCSPMAFGNAAVTERKWLVSQLFRIFSQQIEYSVKWGRPWPPNIWRELHDLYLYLVSRRDIGLSAEDGGGDLLFDPEQEYKRLLLLGLAKRLVRPRDRSSALYRGLSAWARGSTLKDPSAHGGAFGLYVVEISCDVPPRQLAGALDSDFNGWVLEPAEDFLDYVSGCSTSEQPVPARLPDRILPAGKGAEYHRPMSHKHCYSLETALSAGSVSEEFQIEAIRSWLTHTRSLSLQMAVPQFILKLDRLSHTAVAAAVRVAVLQELKRPLLKAVAGLPKPVSPEYRPGREATAMALEQRLCCLMAKNLKQTLQDIDSFADSFKAEMDKRRRWTVRNLFRFIARQIEFSVFWDRPAPTSTWQELHDLFSYVWVRGYDRPRGSSLRLVRNADFDPQQEYIRMLLLGLAARQSQQRELSPSLLDAIARWAGESRLVAPELHVGELEVFVVEVSRDAPPRKVSGALAESFRGWVLEPAPGFVDYLNAVAGAGPDVLLYGDVRSVSGLI